MRGARTRLDYMLTVVYTFVVLSVSSGHFDNKVLHAVCAQLTPTVIATRLHIRSKPCNAMV